MDSTGGTPGAPPATCPPAQHRTADQSNSGPTCQTALKHRQAYARPGQRCTTHEQGHKAAWHRVGRQDSPNTKGGTGEEHLGARTRRPKGSLGSVVGDRHGERCTGGAVYTVRTGGTTVSDGAGRNRVKRDTELCMQRGPESRGKQTGVPLGRDGPGHNTRRSQSTDHHIRQDSHPDSHMDNHQMRQHGLQRDRPIGEQADGKAANTNIHSQNRGRSQDPTANGQHARLLTLNQAGMQGSKTRTASRVRAKPWCAMPANDHTHRHNGT